MQTALLCFSLVFVFWLWLVTERNLAGPKKLFNLECKLNAEAVSRNVFYVITAKGVTLDNLGNVFHLYIGFGWRFASSYQYGPNPNSSTRAGRVSIRTLM